MRFAFILLCTAVPASASIIGSGSFWPNPLHSGDGVVSSQLQLGVGVSSTGSVAVTDGDIMTTQAGVFLGYTVGATGNIAITDSTWLAESAVFIAPQFWTESTVHLTNSIWTVESNVALAQGEGSTAIVTLDADSSWTVEFGVTVASGEDCEGTVNLNSGTWTALSGVTVGGSGFVGSNGTGTINILADGVMESQYGLDVTSYGIVLLDGGLLSLAGVTDFNGSVSATANGGIIRINAGPVFGRFGLVSVGHGVDFTNCDLDIVFHSNYTPDTSNTFDLFDPIDEVDLATTLSLANLITTPTNWVLDRSTGVLSFVSFSSCITGPDVEASKACQIGLDFDTDTDVDLDDFAAYQQIFSDHFP